jgi:hypothetical protein
MKLNQMKLSHVAGTFSDTKDVPIADNIFYQCTRCGTVIPSNPSDNVNCACYLMGIDKDMHRLSVDDFSYFQVLRAEKLL